MLDGVVEQQCGREAKADEVRQRVELFAEGRVCVEKSGGSSVAEVKNGANAEEYEYPLVTEKWSDGFGGRESKDASQTTCNQIKAGDGVGYL